MWYFSLGVLRCVFGVRYEVSVLVLHDVITNECYWCHVISARVIKGTLDRVRGSGVVEYRWVPLDTNAANSNSGFLSEVFSKSHFFLSCVNPPAEFKIWLITIYIFTWF